LQKQRVLEFKFRHTHTHTHHDRVRRVSEDECPESDSNMYCKNITQHFKYKCLISLVYIQQKQTHNFSIEAATKVCIQVLTGLGSCCSDKAKQRTSVVHSNLYRGRVPFWRTYKRHLKHLSEKATNCQHSAHNVSASLVVAGLRRAHPIAPTCGQRPTWLRLLGGVRSRRPASQQGFAAPCSTRQGLRLCWRKASSSFPPRKQSCNEGIATRW
jgi:hypothetical protein